jgi:hypothetical protein
VAVNINRLEQFSHGVIDKEFRGVIFNCFRVAFPLLCFPGLEALKTNARNLSSSAPFYFK